MKYPTIDREIDEIPNRVRKGIAFIEKVHHGKEDLAFVDVEKVNFRCVYQSIFVILRSYRPSKYDKHSEKVHDLQQFELGFTLVGYMPEQREAYKKALKEEWAEQIDRIDSGRKFSIF